ncbi:MAG TPA: M56 family metallopeptidase, partial [Gemmatimonadaceae bacterium]|nr:M56 family metallopeptidase [Gemmatimonadaceae bacterium]
ADGLQSNPESTTRPGAFADYKTDIEANTGSVVRNTRTPSPSSALIAPANISPSASPSLLETLALIWVGGIGAGLIALAAGLLALRRLALKARPFKEESWNLLLENVRHTLSITRPVRLLRSDSAAMPATWGIRKPVVLLPADADNWTEDRKRVVLLHELAHIRRNDCFMQLVAQVSCATYWFHPGVWYTARRMRSERELACDEQVLNAGVNACDYASHLLDIARVFRTPAATSMAAIAMARPNQLEGRLLAILDGETQPRPAVRPITRLVVMSAITALVLPLAAMRPWRAAPLDNLPTLSERLGVLGALVPSDVAAARDTFRWRGIVPAGEWVEIHSTMGDIRAEAASGSEVEVFAILQSSDTQMDAKVLRDSRKGGTRFCVVHVSATSCEDDMGGGVRHGSAKVRTDFAVKVPRGVGLAAHTVNGNIAAESMQSYVWGTARRGDIAISTSDLAEASTNRGSISASFGKAAWRQNLEFLSDSGDVTVQAPANSAMMFELSAERGRVVSEFPSRVRAIGAGQRTAARIGESRGMLTVHTLRGTAQLRRGPSGDAIIPVESYSDAPLSYVDPKPNPNPNPSYDPNPNPADTRISVDVERNFSTSDTATNADDPTGERVPVKIPQDILARYSAAYLRTAPDARAIQRFRDIAASHVKKHAADLVRERSMWALTIVRDGRVIEPLISALRDSDWRVRSYAAWALGATRDSRRVEPLVSALKDSHWRVRMHAASALEANPGAKGVESLIGLLDDQHWQVRIAAIDALAESRDSRVIAELKNLVNDSHPVVRGGAQTALERLSQ